MIHVDHGAPMIMPVMIMARQAESFQQQFAQCCQMLTNTQVGMGEHQRQRITASSSPISASGLIGKTSPASAWRHSAAINPIRASYIGRTRPTFVRPGR